MNEQAKFSVQVGTKIIEIVGSEAFIETQIDRFGKAIDEILGDLPPQEAHTTAPENNDVLDGSEQSRTKYPNALHIDEDRVQILKSVPGNTIAKRAVDTAVVYLWGKRAAGVGSISFTELRDICRDSGCLDETNFSKHMKGARSWIIVEGVKGSSAKTCRLTLPGVAHAEEVLAQLNA
jgi:hypothetical protein